MAFEDILASISEEADRNNVAAMATKYPSLRQYVERGEQLSKIGQRLKGLSGDGPKNDYEQDPELAVTELENWRSWKFDKWPKWEKDFTDQKKALEEAQAKIAEIEANGLDMTDEQIQAMVDERIKARMEAAGLTTKKDLEDLVQNKIKPAWTQDLNGVTTRVEDVFSAMGPRMFDHQKVYGETLNPKEVFDYMKKNNLMDPQKAYEQWSAPKEAARQAELHKAEVAKAKEDGMREGRLQAAQSSNGRASIVDGKGSDDAGPLVTRYRQKREELSKAGKMVPDDTRLGSGLIARAASREFAEKSAKASMP